MPIPWGRIGILVAVIVAVFAWGWNWGGDAKQAEWDRAENVALEDQRRLREIAEDERDVANDLMLEKQIALEGAELYSARLEDELQIAITRESSVTTISVSTPGGCPVVQCNLPDVGSFFRLYNCGTNNESCETIPASDETSLGNGSNSRTNGFTFVDGVYGRDHKNRPF